MSGIERNVDKLGRIVLPKKYRQKLGIQPDDKVIVRLDKGVITVSPSKRICALCGGEVKAASIQRICDLCIQEIKDIGVQINMK